MTDREQQTPIPEGSSRNKLQKLLHSARERVGGVVAGVKSELKKPAETLRRVEMIREAQKHAKVIIITPESSQVEIMGGSRNIEELQEIVRSEAPTVTGKYEPKLYEVVTDDVEEYRELLNLATIQCFPHLSREQRQELVDESIDHEMKHLRPLLREDNVTALLGIQFVQKQRISPDGKTEYASSFYPFASFNGTVTREVFDAYSKGGDDVNHSATDIATRAILDAQKYSS